MFKTKAKCHPGNHPLAWIVAAGTVSLFFPSPASAHFVLQEPASWWSQDGNGGPQKQGPCGNAN